MGRGFMAMMSAMAEDERLRIIKRTHEGRQIARAKGVRMGRKPKLTPHQMKDEGGPAAACQGRGHTQPCQELRRQHQHDFAAHGMIKGMRSTTTTMNADYCRQGS
jgi:DNA invertase Pin-like site-specific DNA recombinase